MKAIHARALADLRGVVRLAAHATGRVADLAEGVHRAVDDTLGVAARRDPERARGIAGFVYGSVRGIASLSGRGLAAGLSRLESRARAPGLEPGDEPDSRRRRIALAVLNGVLGDHLAADDNPLALEMGLWGPGGSPLPPDTGGKVLLMVHGLCLSDLAWQPIEPPEPGDGEDRVHLGGFLSSALGHAPVYLRYNSGLHISENGRRLSALLEDWVSRSERPLRHLDVVAHSMGGLVLRGALHAAEEQGHRWPRALGHLVFLGTPHHGAPLERIGRHLDALLGTGRFTRPFRRLVRLRSAGITDLRHGTVRDEDWRGRDRFQDSRDRRPGPPLPEGITYHVIAADLATEESSLAARWRGDGLVPVDSALGRHASADRHLPFPDASRQIVYGTGHNGLMHRREVAELLLHRLG